MFKLPENFDKKCFYLDDNSNKIRLNSLKESEVQLQMSKNSSKFQQYYPNNFGHPIQEQSHESGSYSEKKWIPTYSNYNKQSHLSQSQH